MALRALREVAVGVLVRLAARVLYPLENILRELCLWRGNMPEGSRERTASRNWTLTGIRPPAI